MSADPRLGVRPRGLLLDAMGTLIGLRRTVGEEYAAAAAHHGLSPNPAALETAFRRAYRQAPALAFPGLQGDALELAERTWWTERIEATFRAVGITELPPSLCRDLFDRFAAPEPWMVYPEVPRLLERWHGQGLRLAVVSNFDRRLNGILESFGLAAWLDAVVVSSAAGHAKPDPGLFVEAMQQLDLTAGELWHVGDSPEDRAGAQAAGIACVMVRRR